MPEEAIKQKEEKKDIVAAPKKDAKLIVMPQEFRTKKKKSKISKKMLLIIGAVLFVNIGTIIVAMVLLGSRPKQPLEQTTTPTTTTPTQPTTPTAPTQSTTTTPIEPPSLTQPATTTPPTQTVPEPVVVPGTLTQGSDNDSDGLTDKEEAIFQTDAKKPDTDSDGFLDGNEVFHLYNPAAIAPVDLIASGIVKEYKNTDQDYSIYYPSLWSTSSTTDTSMISFLSDETESINITIIDTSSSITLRSWYIGQFPNADINLLQNYTSKQGYQGLQDSNRLNTYIKQGGKVYIINYDLGGITTVWYRRLYDMMLNSLKIE